MLSSSLGIKVKAKILHLGKVLLGLRYDLDLWMVYLHLSVIGIMKICIIPPPFLHGSPTATPSSVHTTATKALRLPPPFVAVGRFACACTSGEGSLSICVAIVCIVWACCLPIDAIDISYSASW